MSVHRHNKSYSEIASSEKFQALLAAKKRFILPMTLFFLAFYFTLPILTSYSKALNHQVAGAITWAWLFAFAQFIMTWVLCYLYTKKAVKFDELSNEIVADVHQKQRKAG